MLRDLPPFADEGGQHLLMNGAPGNEEDAQTYVDPFDDVFGSAPGSPTIAGNEDDVTHGRGPASSSVLEHSDISRLRSTHVTNGYREGIAASKELHMQDGFDEGYNLGAELGLKAGWCLGALEGIWRAMPADHVEPSVTVTDGRQGIGRDERATLLNTAKAELEISQLCGKEYFGEDGLWLYEVPGQQDEEQGLTFDSIAAAHPLLRKWRMKIEHLTAQVGLSLA